MKLKASVTMKDVAKRAGVSVGTVSRVVNKEQGIKASTLEKVNKAIEDLQYVPDVYARGMKKNKTATIALIIPTIWHPFFSEFAYYVETELAKQDYKVLICNINGPKKELDYISMLQQNKVDGIIAITYSPIEDYLVSNIPFVSIDRTYSDKEIACVTSDNRYGAELAATILIEKGCRTFAFVGSHNKTMNETKNRRVYYERTIKKAGFTCEIFDLEEPFVNFKEQLEVFLRKNKEIDGIFAINDFVAMEVLTILEKLKRRVPEDVQIIGYDGIRMAQDKDYLVSTIKQPLESMAKEAIKTLLAIIDNQPREMQVVLPITYVEGRTTKKG